jgi:hypothetical protein
MELKDAAGLQETVRTNVLKLGSIVPIKGRNSFKTITPAGSFDSRNVMYFERSQTFGSFLACNPVVIMNPDEASWSSYVSDFRDFP